MEKLTKTIESLSTILMAYPRWAHNLFIITTCMSALSIVVFLILLPSAKKKLGTIHGSDTFSSSSPLIITQPKSGKFVTTHRFTMYGKGAKPTENNIFQVKVIHVPTGTWQIFQGRLVVNSDQTWRFEDVELQQAGPYDKV